jgi:hypothetical protein
MRFEFESYDVKCKRLNRWRNWFAWYPVFLDDCDKPTLIWLEKIQRKKLSPASRWHYRRVPDFDLFV